MPLDSSVLPPRSKTGKSRSGFALLITITLLAFLVLLLVSLASLTRVETQVAGNNQQLSQARQNTLMALNIALGQLQKYAGPDQRVTAPAAFATGAPVAQLADTKKGLVAPVAGTRQWLGVWGNSSPANDIYGATPSPVFLNWLVSGNEQTAAPVPAADGHISSPSVAAVPTYKPDQVPAALSLATTATDQLSLNGSPAILLVGPRTAGNAVGALDRYIATPLVSIKSSSVPGLANTPVTVGRYAYWIGDEGVKARYNLRDGYTDTDASTSAQARYRLRTPARNAVELLSGFSGYTVNAPSLDSVQSPAQLRLADTALTETSQQLAFHDLTTSSWGVLSNSQTGGLRTDLSHALQQPSLGTNFTGAPVIPAITPAGFTQPVTPLQGPKWETVKSFFDLTTAAGASTTASPVAVRPASANTMGISPVIVQNRLAFGIDFTPKGATNSARRFYICVSAAFVLSNPYTFPIRASDGLDFSYAITTATGSEWGINLDRRDTAGAVHVPPFDRAKYPAKTALGNASTYYPVLVNKIDFGNDGASSVLGNVKFHIPAVTLQPGEIKTFTIPDTTGGALGPVVTMAEGVYFGYYKHDTGTDVPPHVGSPNNGYFLRMLSAGTMTLQMAMGGSTALDGLATQPQAGALQLIVNADLSADNATTAASNTNSQVSPKPTGFNTIFTTTVTPADFSGYGMSLALPVPDTTFYNSTFASTRMGTHRTYADYNLTALNFALPPVAPLLNTTNATTTLETVPPYTRQYIQSGGQVLSGGSATPLGSNSFKNGLLTPRWGTSTAPSGKASSVLYDIPKRASSDEAPFFSIGQLQHADLTGDDTYLSVSYQPRHAVGNSAYNPYVSRTTSVDTRTRASPQPNGIAASGNVRLFDLSYLLNTALWDRFFFSSLIQSGPAAGTPANQRLAFAGSYQPTATQLGIGAGDTQVADLSGNGTQLLPEMTAARYLMIKGAFNINSTSVDAWRAALAGSRSLPLSGETTGTPAARSLAQPLASVDADKGAEDTTFSGYRRLTDPQITALANQIVDQVRQRGPFVSLAHFINRKIGPDNDPLTTKGALQSAIDAASLNPFGDAPDTAGTTPTLAYAANNEANLGNRSTGVPGWLTQADLLQSLGPVLSARSDTFTVRVYGDVINPLDQTTVVARAWCEATVQRFPDYVDTTVSAAATPSNVVNSTFGRKFRVISFRWLTAADI